MFRVHLRQHEFRQQKRRTKMYGHHFVEFRKWILFHWNHRAVMPRIIHKNVDFAEFCSCRRNDLRAIGFPR